MTEQTRYACLDVETGGLPDHSLPADHPSQPKLAHLAMVYLDSDLDVLGQDDLYVKPEGWTMPDEVFAINGLSTKFLHDYGSPIGEVLDLYTKAVLSGYVIVGWNIVFDLKVVRGSLRVAGRPDLFEQTPNICIMRAFKDWRKIFKGYKLVDACRYFGIPYERIHRAPADALAAVEVFRHLVRAGAPIPAAQVHFHKDHAAIVARGVS